MSRVRWGALIVAVCLVVTMLTGTAWGQPAAGNWGGAYEIYQVRPGDTVQNIAVRFGVSPDLISNFNALLGPGELVPGQDLAVPILGSANEEEVETRPLPQRIPPRCAVVVKPSLITKEPGGEDSLWGFPVGSLVIVNAEVHSYRGVAVSDPGDIAAAELLGQKLDSYWGVGLLDGRTGWIEKSHLKVSDDTIAPGKLKALREAENAYKRDMAKAEKAYNKALLPAGKAWEKAIAPAREAYIKAVVQAGKDYDVSRVPPTDPETARMVMDAYDRAVAKAKKPFNKATDRAWKVYYKASGPTYEAHSKAVARAVAKAEKARKKVLAAAGPERSGRAVK